MLSLEELGLTTEQVQERVVETIADRLMSGYSSDDDGRSYEIDSQFGRKMKEEVQRRIDTTCAAFCEKHILPHVNQYIENLTIQKTNAYGERKGEPQTFVEYLVATAENYLTENVDSSGKSKAESDSYSWSGKQTRISQMIHHHLHYEIETAMKQAVGNANASITEGLKTAVAIKLNEIAQRLQVSVNTGR